MKWMKNSSGKPDAMFTMSVISFIVTTMCVILSLFKEIKFQGTDFKLNIPDVSLLTLYIGSTFGSYVVRRNATDKLEIKDTTEDREKKE